MTLSETLFTSLEALHPFLGAQQEENRLILQLKEERSKEEIKSLLQNLSQQAELSFFDAFHEQISDPGAHIYVQKNSESFWIALANTGWCSPWKRIDFEELAELIFKNKGSQTQNSFHVSKVKRPAKEKEYKFEMTEF